MGSIRAGLLAAGIRAGLLLFGWLAYILTPQESRVTPPDPRVPIEWLSIWAQWDVGHYLRIAESGYQLSEVNTLAFFPLYPITSKILAFVVGNYFIAGLLISYVSIILASVLLYNLTILLSHDASVAMRTVFYLNIFPGSFYFSTMYSESLYLLLAVASFYLLERGWLWASGLTGALLAATRSLGVLIVVPLLLLFGARVYQRQRNLSVWVVALILPLAGLVGAMLIYSLQTGDALAFTRGRASFGHELAWPFVTLWKGWEVVNWQHIVPGFRENYTTNAINFASAILFLVLGLVAIRKLGLAYGVFTLIGVLIPLVFNPLGSDRPVNSMLRFTAVLFPGFIILGYAGRRLFADRLISTAFLLFLGLLTALFLRSWNVAGVS